MSDKIKSLLSPIYITNLQKRKRKTMEAFSMGDKMIDKHARMFVKYHQQVNTIGYCVKKALS